MKINECSVIDNKVIDYAIRTLIADGNHVLAQELKSHLKSLEPIVRDFHTYGQFAKMELLATGKINIHSVDLYINETEI